ncbi:MAG: 3-phosphoshikimate 1-carboxyvinyltransferase [Myxococcota bacterium]|nr:3-phosphoshikimate 1-carboxyvinyltransferase [Myxococcota bacterium]
MRRRKVEVRVPGDKSIGHRALLFAAIADGESQVRGIGRGADLQSTRAVLEQLGVSIVEREGGLSIRGVGLYGLRGDGKELDCGNSGTTMRLLSGLLAGQGGAARTRLIGDTSLSRRPMARVAEALSPFGGIVELSEGGRAPLIIEGAALSGATYHTGRASAQVKSAALFAALLAEGQSKISERAQSRDHSERMLKALGVDLKQDGLTLSLSGGQRFDAFELTLPGDPSSAAFWAAVAALRPELEVEISGVSLNKSRGGFFEVLERMGATLEREVEGYALGEPFGRLCVRCDGLSAVRVDGTLALRALDELPLVALLAALAEGESEIRDARELRVKESDRITAMTEGLRALGVTLEEHQDGWTIQGQTALQGGKQVRVHEDHRIAIVFQLAALRSEGPVHLDEPRWAAISYPRFSAELAQAIGDGARTH